MRALAIDLGTTACKASVVAIDGRLIGSGVCRLVTEFGDGEVAEQDAEQVWQAALTASRAAIAEVESATATPLPSLRFTGGGAQSAVWAQIMADGQPRPIEQVAEPRHANARGAALLGFVAVGALALDDLAELVPIAARFEPTLASTPSTPNGST